MCEMENRDQQKDINDNFMYIPSIKRAKKTDDYIIFQFSDDQMIAFHKKKLHLLAFDEPLDTWQPILKTDVYFNVYIQAIISFINEQYALSQSTLYQILLRRE